jgi:hypothetical protein
VAGFILVIPLFFEPRVETERYMKYEEYNSTHIILVSSATYPFFKHFSYFAQMSTIITRFR